MNDGRTRTDDPFLLSYNDTDLQIASEFLTTWLPFLSRDLCHHCTRILSDRIRSLDPEVGGDVESSDREENLTVSTPNNTDLNECSENQDNCNTNSLGSSKDGADVNDTADTNSLGSWKDGANGWSEPIAKASTCGTSGSPVPTESPRVRMSWADMALEDELEAEEEDEANRQPSDRHASSGEATMAVKGQPKPELPREQREYIRFTNVRRKKDFICLERVKGKIVNILDGLELHTGVFSAAEQKRIVDFVYMLQEMGKKGELKERTFTAPQKRMRGKGCVTIQFGCCYTDNYAKDKNDNPSGILQNEIVDPIPPLFKVIITRLVRWHVIPPSCVPDSCIVNIYDEGDCIPPHIDNHDFLRPFCTVSFLSECDIVFGSNLKIVGAGKLSGAFAIPLPVGSVLVLNRNGADVAKHCVPAVPTKRISITFRKMDESRWPFGFIPEPDLQGLQPLSYEEDRSRRMNPSKSNRAVNRQAVRREDYRDNARNSDERGNTHLEPHCSIQIQLGPGNRRRVRMNLDG